MAKKIQQIEPAQNCEEILKIGDIIFICDDETKGHITPHCSQRKIGDLKSLEGCHITYIISWRKVPNIILSSSQN